METHEIKHEHDIMLYFSESCYEVKSTLECPKWRINLTINHNWNWIPNAHFVCMEWVTLWYICSRISRAGQVAMSKVQTPQQFENRLRVALWPNSITTYCRPFFWMERTKLGLNLTGLNLRFVDRRRDLRVFVLKRKVNGLYMKFPTATFLNLLFFYLLMVSQKVACFEPS